MRFIHAADIHLDSPLRGLSAYPDAPAERLRTATRDAFQNLVTRAIDESVEFMVIAGDVYDGDWKDFNTGLFFVRQMGRLRQASIPDYLIYGNHGAESEMTWRHHRKLASRLSDSHSRVVQHRRASYGAGGKHRACQNAWSGCTVLAPLPQSNPHCGLQHRLCSIVSVKKSERRRQQ